ncbi:hypothetical protein AMJ83_01420 [candidate division WOR_3 bacterium SM23_42]|uniref:Uncharacterized protein n=1 Tax=candidate division WOR_3 bacterium SM23_42 TaxID=1703779 RepID=A0A0S8FW53_UNCW3|nr:MAG: hypothetical protein AMJ83_01420 [candidate division WOR_3 bacterium SM23_42]
MLLLFLASLTLPGISSQGDRIFYHDARSLSLGGVSIVLGMPDNPASMGLMNEKRVFVSGWFVVQNERRGLRVYDSYGNNIGISTVTNNTATYPSVGPSGIVFPFRALRFGLRYAPVWDYDYYYRYEQRDDFYQIVRIDEHSYRGYTHSISPMFSFKYNFINIGVEYGFLLGNWSKEEKIIVPQTADSIEAQETDFSGNKVRVGFVLAPDLSFRFAYTYQHEYELVDLGFSFPTTHSLGIMYQPPGRIPTKFVGQIDLETWGPVILGFAVDDRPIFVYKIGVEHMILGRYALRYGFCIFPDYMEPAIWTTTLTLGFGLNTGTFSLDLGYGYGKRDFLNSDFYSFDVGTNYKFDETTHQLLISIGLRF